MTTWLPKLYTFIALCLLLVENVSGLECYQCASTGSNGQCKDPFDVFASDRVSQNCVSCFKMTSKFSDDTLTVRGCVSDTPLWTSGCQTMTDTQTSNTVTYETKVCFCDLDGCNHSSILNINVIYLLIVTASLKLIL